MADSNTKKTTTSKTATETASAPVKSALTASSLPAADTLKERFKAGSIPLQSDFADLIDMANVGAQAAGKAASQDGPGKGMRLSSSGQLEPDIGSYNFKDDKQGCSPVKVNTDTNQIVVDIDDGLIEGDSGLSVKAGNGITVNSDGVSIDPQKVLPKGIITMFSGDKAPDGWALCDGNNGTPDLRNRFVMGGDISDISGKSDETFSGTKDSKIIKFSSEDAAVKVKGTTKGHALTEAESAPHTHYIGITVGPADKAINGGRTLNEAYDWIGGSDSKDSNKTEPESTSSGGGKEHDHDVDLTSDSHSHSNKLSVPYFILAFIMKL